MKLRISRHMVLLLTRETAGKKKKLKKILATRIFLPLIGNKQKTTEKSQGEIVTLNVIE